MSNETLNIKYDPASDVLYISKGQSALPGVVKHGDPGLLWRHDAETGKLVGLTVMDYAYYWRPRLPDLVEQIARRLELSEKAAQDALRQVA